MVSNLRVFYFYTQGCGCTGHPAFPAPLCPENLSGCANGRLPTNRPLLELSPLRPKATELVTAEGEVMHNSGALASREGRRVFFRHSGMVRQHQTRNLEIPGSTLRIAPE